ncbi:MAG: protein translocase subunit SecF [Candidatus Peregrinibacteria bacterium]|nr:protein translocase subunit SecF [Candidatus Peregrinibacteria bacterium]
MKRFLSWKIVGIILIALFLGFYDLSPEIQSKLIPFTPEALKTTRMQLGLDLQGGSQLDYKIDLRDVPAEYQQDIIEGVMDVITKRVNGLGVAEPNIYIADLPGEKHIVVELAENAQITQADVDKYLNIGKKAEEKRTAETLTSDESKKVSLEKAKETVGKTIQLEFKEKKESIDPQEKEKVKENALVALNDMKNGQSFEVVAQEESLINPEKVKYSKPDYQTEDQLPSSIKDALGKLKIGEYTKELVETGGTFVVDDTGNAVEDTGLGVIKLIDKQEEKLDKKEVSVSHILISYKDAKRADESVVRTQDEAKQLAEELKTKLESGEDFAKLAKEYSDDKSNKDTGGVLDNPVKGDGSYAYDFEKASLALTKKDELSSVTKTEFGYHIIKATDVKTSVNQVKYKYESLVFSTLPDAWQDTDLTGKYFVHADVQLDNFYQPFVAIQFNDEGAKLFEDLTAKNVGKPIAIFVGGNKISAPKVNEKITGGKAVIQGSFTSEEAKELARNLNTGAIPAPIILSGEYTIGATLGEEALNQSMVAGLIGLFLVMAFLILMYRLPGIFASFALLIYISILLFVLKSQLPMWAALIISITTFVFLLTKVINSKDSGWEKFISFTLSCLAFFFLTVILKSGVVMTLAGIAGVIMSIGVAVDANVLIFERLKEELKTGKTFNAALDAGFDRAWAAIRDSNFSTLITCAILFYFGSSMIRGFAMNLSIGIIISMFTAIIVTKTLLKTMVGKEITQNLKLFGVNPNAKPKEQIHFIKNAKKFLTVSATLFVLSILSFFIIGPNLGTDFTGGTLLEFQFEKPITKDEISKALVKAGDELKNLGGSIMETKTEDKTSEKSVIDTSGTSTTDKAIVAEDSQKSEEVIDLASAKVLESGENGYIIKTKYLTSQTHEKLLSILKDKLPTFEEKRFTTMGPIVGSSILQKSLIAVLLASVMIILYISFAFRKIPKQLNPWRFGVAAIVALIHDITIVTGIFIVLGKVLNVEIDALFITAMLTVLGYSVNDTIVIFDRLRENILTYGKLDNFAQVTDDALNQTLRRSIGTALSTIIALTSILIFGSSSIFYFILALTIGIMFGTYSSIFVASPMLVYWKAWSDKQK